MKYVTELTRALLPIIITAAIAGGSGYLAGKDSITPPPLPAHLDGQNCWYEWNTAMPNNHELLCRTPGSRYR